MPTTVKKVATSKSTSKKAVVKKVASVTKKTSVKKVTTQTLVYADNEHSFWVHDGQILNSLTALRDALQVMDKAVFTHHVGKSKNDFADWVESVLDDRACALDLRKAKTAASAVMVVKKHLTRYHQ